MQYKIESLAKGGEGITRCQGKTYFIRKALPGEEGEFRITEDKKGFGRGEVIKCNRVSHDRVKDLCRARGCGGCGFRHVNPKVALELKAQAIHDNIMRQAKFSPDVPVHFWPVTNIDNARRRVRIHVSRHAAGLYEQGSHKIVNIDSCLALSPALLNAVRDVSANFTWKCDPILDVQIDLDMDDRAFALVTVADPDGEDNTRKNNRNCRDRKPFMGRFEKQSVAGYLSDAVARGVFAGAQFENQLWGLRSIADAVDVDGHIVYTERRIGGFAQATSEGNTLLHRLLTHFLVEHKPETVYDLFCGAGNFTFRAALFCKHVHGVEFFCDRELFRLGQERTKQHQPLGEVKLRLHDLGKGLPDGMDHADLVIADPPRAGMSPALCSQLMEMHPPFIFYVSCEASCLGRDLQKLLEGYEPIAFHYVDMFPQTPDVETVCILKCRAQGCKIAVPDKGV